MRIACWIPTATDTNSEYVILIAFPNQQRLLGRTLMLRYTQTACLVLLHVAIYILFYTNVPFFFFFFFFSSSSFSSSFSFYSAFSSFSSSFSFFSFFFLFFFSSSSPSAPPPSLPYSPSPPTSSLLLLLLLLLLHLPLPPPTLLPPPLLLLLSLALQPPMAFSLLSDSLPFCSFLTQFCSPFHSYYLHIFFSIYNPSLHCSSCNSRTYRFPV